MKKKFNKFIFLFLMPIVSFLLIGVFSVSVLKDSAFADRNGGGVYVGNNSKFNMTRGTLTGFNISGNGGAVYVSEDGTFNMTAGSIYGNTATLSGNNIYNAGTFTMSGGTVFNNSYPRCDKDGVENILGDYVKFGMYPKTIKAADVSVNESIQDENGYFLGSDGNYYAKLTAVSTDAGYGLQADKRTFTNGDLIVNGNVYYFKVEPILWKILKIENGTAMLISDMAIDRVTYATDNNNKYDISNARTWLNSNFYNSAFSSSEKQRIVTTEIDNSAESTGFEDNLWICDNTYDNVTILSCKEFLEYNTKFSLKYSKTSDYAVAKNAVYTSSKYSYWYTRSPWWETDESSKYYNQKEFLSGVASYLDKTYLIRVDDEHRSILPVIYLDLTNNSENTESYGIYNTGTMNLYGGKINDNIYSSVSFNVKPSAQINGIIYLPDGVSIVVEDYDGSVLSYNIKVTSNRTFGDVLITLQGNNSVPDLSKLNIFGYDDTLMDLVSTWIVYGVYNVTLEQSVKTFPSTWKEEIVSTEYMNSPVQNTSSLTSIKFLNNIPDNYSCIGKLSSGLKVFANNQDSSKIAFIASVIIAPTECNNLFANCSSLSEIAFDNFNTSNVTNMSNMFYNCSKLTSLDVSKFNTSKVTDMSNMFYNCSKLTSLDVSKFDTSKVTTMYYMFRDCASLKSLNLANWKTPNNTSLQGFVYGCLALETLTFGSNFDTSKVTDMGSAFRDTSLSSLDLSSFDTSKVTDMGGMFQANAKLETINFGSNWNTQSVTTFYIMFDGCVKLSELNLSGWNTANATDFGGMFTGCGFSSLDISSFRTTKATSMLAMFKDCSNLTRLDLHNFYVWNVTDMKDMFSGCTSLVYLDLSSFNLRNISSENYEGMLNLGTSNMIEVLKAPCYNSTLTITTAVNILYSEDGNSYSRNLSTNKISLETNTVKSILYTSYGSKTFSASWKTHVNNLGLNYSNITSIKFVSIAPEGYSYFGTSNDIKVYRKNGTNDIAFVAMKISAPSSCSSLFSDLTSLEQIDFDVFNTENVTKMDYMFKNCSSLKKLDLRNFTCSEVESSGTLLIKFLVQMFYGCDSLEYLDLSSFDLTKFSSPSGSNSDFLNFGSNNNIKKIKTPYNVKVELKITTNSTLYDEDGNVVTSVPKGTTTSLTYKSYDSVEFPQAWKTELSSSNYMTETINASNLVDIKFVEEVPAGYTLIGTLSTGLKVYKGSSSNQIAFVAEIINAPQSCNGLFQNLALLKNIEFETFKTTNVTDMSYMFSGCENLLKLDLRNFRTTAMSVNTFLGKDICDHVKYMFQNCKSLIYLDLSEFDMKARNSSTLNDSNSYFLNFGSDNKIEVLKTPYNNYYVLNITTGSVLYDSNNNRVSLVESRTTSSITLKNYTKVSFSENWKTEISRTTYMSETVSYSEIEDIKFLSSIPEGYTLIGTLSSRLSVYKGATTKQIAFVAKSILAPSNYSSLFSDLTSLKTINFENFDTSSVTNMSYMFSGCSSLINIDLSNFNTSNVANMEYMFSGCSSLLKLDLSSFSTDSLGSRSSIFDKIQYMFKNCTSLTYLDLSSFDLKNGQSYTSSSNNTFLNFVGTVPMLLFKAPYNNYYKLVITSMVLVSVIPAGETESYTYTTGPLFAANSEAGESICVVSGGTLEKANVVYALPESKKKNTKIIVEDKVA